MRTTVIFVIVVSFLIGSNECGRYRGGGSRPSARRPSPSRPSPAHPAPTHRPPSSDVGWKQPATSRPSQDIGWKPDQKQNVNPVANAPPPYAPPASRPVGWNPPDQKQNVNPVGNAPPPYAPPASRPVGWSPPAHNPQNPPQTYYPGGNGPVQPPKVSYPSGNAPQTTGGNQRPIGWNPPPAGQNNPQTHYPGNNNPVHYPGSNQQPNTKVNYPGTNQQQSGRPVGWDLPPAPRPGHPPQPIGPPTYNHQTYSQGPTKVKIVNNHYHSPGAYSLPQPSYYSGYYQNPSYYHYTSHDTGSGALGFFLGYSLAKLTTPTYTHYSFYDGYRPRYDHYTVHHYYHDKEAIPPNPVVQANTIIGCVGDSSSICPANTTSLCTSNGALMCVASAFSTVPCTGNTQVNCVKSTIPCVNNTAPECKNSQASNAVVSIPCVSTAKIYGDLKFVNNTIIVNNSTGATNTTASNITVSNTTASNLTASNTGVISTGNSSVAVTVAPLLNGTSTETTWFATYPTNSSSTQYPITTTPVPVTTQEGVTTQYPITTTPAAASARRKRDIPQDFCVTIVALPAKKATTEGEELFKNTKNVVSKFLVKAWGL